ncbi:Helicase associated domain protein [Glutamicibacter nicotianae]|nr:Helicase associated domain protein [Glutamicibacter nicotianae]
MTSWSISRHPEWDQLLLAGITVREIAELCHRGPATIHYHLRRREHYEPGFRAKHEAAVATRNNNRPSSTWRRQATELAAFHAEHERLPRSTGDRGERSLHHWVAVQRKEFQSGQLPAAKILLLQDVPDWHIDLGNANSTNGGASVSRRSANSLQKAASSRDTGPTHLKRNIPWVSGCITSISAVPKGNLQHGDAMRWITSLPDGEVTPDHAADCRKSIPRHHIQSILVCPPRHADLANILLPTVVVLAA